MDSWDDDQTATDPDMIVSMQGLGSRDGLRKAGRKNHICEYSDKGLLNLEEIIAELRK